LGNQPEKTKSNMTPEIDSRIKTALEAAKNYRK
jgi:uncharacterized protein YeaC (DUF1315 family)